MVAPPRSLGLLLVASSAFSTPLAVGDDHVVDGCAWLAEEMRKWLPGGEVVVVFPPDSELTPWARGIQARLSYIGILISDKKLLAAEPRRTGRCGSSTQTSALPATTTASRCPDRVDTVVPLGEIIPWEAVASRVVEYAGVMSASSSGNRNFDSYGLAEDVELF